MGSSKRTQRPSNKPKPQLRSRTTRSRGKPLSDPANNTEQLNSQLLALGLYAAPTIGDGNCLFRALSDQLYGTDSFHHKLRKDVCDWIESNKERYEPFVEDDRGLDTHLRCMRENATYGGHMELSAFAHLTRRNVKVIQPGLVYVIEWDAGWDPPPAPADASTSPVLSEEREQRRPKRDKRRADSSSADQYLTSGDTVYVAYHDWEHFSSIRNLRGPHVGAPMVQEMPADSCAETTSAPPKQSSSKGKSKKSASAPQPPPSIASTEASDAPAPPTAPTKLPRIKLRLTEPTPSSSLSSLTSSASSAAGDDPAEVPLPISRSPTPSEASASSSCLSLPLPSSQLQSQPRRYRALPRDLPPSPASHQHRSPKRTFDESSVSSSCSSSSKRTKISSNATARVRTTTTAVKNGDMDIDIESMSTPSLSNSSSSPLSFSSLSSSSSASSSPEPSPPPPPPPVSAEKTLTRRQRKALGLPKKGNGSGTASAGKIIIPGGKFQRGAPKEGEEEEEGAEWRRNGSGRVDVRGFRELKI